MKINIFNPEYKKQVTTSKISTQAGASINIESSTDETLNLRPQASMTYGEIMHESIWLKLT